MKKNKNKNKSKSRLLEHIMNLTFKFAILVCIVLLINTFLMYFSKDNANLSEERINELAAKADAIASEDSDFEEITEDYSIERNGETVKVTIKDSNTKNKLQKTYKVEDNGKVKLENSKQNIIAMLKFSAFLLYSIMLILAIGILIVLAFLLYDEYQSNTVWYEEINKLETA